MQNGIGSFKRAQRALRVLGLAALWCAVATSAVAGPVATGLAPSVSGEQQGRVGDQVSLSFAESGLQGFAGAELSFTFDASKLSLIGVSEDCTVSVAPICGSLLQLDNGLTNQALYSLFLLTSPGAAVNGAAHLFTVLFSLIGGQAGEVIPVTFTNAADFSNPEAVVGVYDRQQFAGAITVLNPGATLPLAGTAPLALTALVLLALPARRRLRGSAARVPG